MTYGFIQLEFYRKLTAETLLLYLCILPCLVDGGLLWEKNIIIHTEMKKIYIERGNLLIEELMYHEFCWPANFHFGDWVSNLSQKTKTKEKLQLSFFIWGTYDETTLWGICLTWWESIYSPLSRLRGQQSSPL